MMGLRRSDKYLIRFEGLPALDPDSPPLLSWKSFGRRACVLATIRAFAGTYLVSFAHSFSERNPTGGSA